MTPADRLRRYLEDCGDPDEVLPDLYVLEARMVRLQMALAEASTHVHDCEELLTPATRRAMKESVAAILAETT